MSETLIVQGRRLAADDILRIRQLNAENCDWSRRRLSEALAGEWDWRNESGRLKDMASRTLLLKLDARGLIKLPPRRRTPSNRMAARRLPRQTWDRSEIAGTLGELGPIMVEAI
jgi:hypothetical protein